MVDIHTVGAGGGSIASLDAGGSLSVGPESAGADPGPICYGKGGQVTVTDANLFLGRLIPEYFLGGSMTLHKERLEGYFDQLAKEAGLQGLCLLGEIPFYTAKIENPKSSLSILRVFIKYREIEIDLDGLLQMAKFVEEEVEKVSKTTKQTLLGAEETAESGTETVYEVTEGENKEEASEKIVPEVRERIEFLFDAAAQDISKAADLKEELDRWGLFPEYEDRFLDLFGKRNL